MYKPGAAMKPSKLHGEFARAMANMLATVDDMADTLALELTALTNPEPVLELDELREQDTGIEVRVRATGPKYALAVDGDGRQGLVPAFAIRRLQRDEGHDQSQRLRPHRRPAARQRRSKDSKGLYYIPPRSAATLTQQPSPSPRRLTGSHEGVISASPIGTRGQDFIARGDEVGQRGTHLRIAARLEPAVRIDPQHGRRAHAAAQPR